MDCGPGPRGAMAEAVTSMRRLRAQRVAEALAVADERRRLSDTGTTTTTSSTSATATKPVLDASFLKSEERQRRARERRTEREKEIAERAVEAVRRETALRQQREETRLTETRRDQETRRHTLLQRQTETRARRDRILEQKQELLIQSIERRSPAPRSSSVGRERSRTPLLSEASALPSRGTQRSASLGRLPSRKDPGKDPPQRASSSGNLAKQQARASAEKRPRVPREVPAKGPSKKIIIGASESNQAGASDVVSAEDPSVKDPAVACEENQAQVSADGSEVKNEIKNEETSEGSSKGSGGASTVDLSKDPTEVSGENPAPGCGEVVSKDPFVDPTQSSVEVARKCLTKNSARVSREVARKEPARTPMRASRELAGSACAGVGEGLGRLLTPTIASMGKTHRAASPAGAWTGPPVAVATPPVAVATPPLATATPCF
ncbi:uncharacterized protein LOC116956550 isoform X2 [Petromyzon marinus]|uniref:MAP7 domain-containing protein 2-like isoform X2 n=1 Tax=Petromyzon marinus TaxID=7757 RepID=A0AAJ7UF77_PETMA|nr:MAP7 domain-containing protein 2-like isoform X2 [Petromyzon marinus]